jgi:predicted DNA-binding antitoxin AbrB/MazE fold protein
MTIPLELIYENDVFRPLQAVQLPEHQRVTVTLEAPPDAIAGSVDSASFALSPERWQAFCDALDAPPREIPTLRALLNGTSYFDDNRDAAEQAGRPAKGP